MTDNIEQYTEEIVDPSATKIRVPKVGSQWIGKQSYADGAVRTIKSITTSDHRAPGHLVVTYTSGGYDYLHDHVHATGFFKYYEPFVRETREQELERQNATLRADRADLQAKLATAESHVQRLSQRLADVRKAAG